MNLKEELLRGIYAFGFEKPSAIQQRAIVPCCTGRDVIAQAQSGTGKTATFSVSVLQRVDEKDPNVQALVMAPTRELAQQVPRFLLLTIKGNLRNSMVYSPYFMQVKIKNYLLEKNYLLTFIKNIILYIQILLVMRALGDFMGVKFHMCIGGTSVRDDQRKLESGVQIVVGTPGRVNDMIQRGALS